ncbi:MULTISPECIES: hypothetical protein [Virgibacillus]|uniref:hypothetical protein n=1 Tax=Virgibacillus TaxID=84406 RepID=UPI00038825B2|nr:MULTISPECIES: hypothetical protein [Virgibacillus]EQB37657.1 hypothetical protein M948_03640 [Virgibacillus sp. CM-4]MYL40396.1 hypothetical protein [Virgibacillus massiliensis]
MLQQVTDPNPGFMGHALSALSALDGLGSFGAAFIIRIRSAFSFDFRKVSWRWLLLGLALGVAISYVSTIAIYYMGYTSMDTQESYRTRYDFLIYPYNGHNRLCNLYVN